MVGGIHGNVTAICETFRISCLMGKHHMTGGSEYHLTTHFVPFAAMVEYHPISPNLLSRLYQFGLKVLPRKFLGCAFYAEENLERRHYGRTH